MVLEYKNLRIRKAITQDASLLATWWNDGSVMAHAGFPLGLETSEEEVSRKLGKDGTHRFIIEKEGTPIGEMCYKEVEKEVAEIGIKICVPQEREKGYGRVLLSLLIQYLFEEAKYQKIILDTDLENLRAQHVYELLGFKKTKIKENAWKNQIGELRGVVYYELIPQNFVNYLK